MPALGTAELRRLAVALRKAEHVDIARELRQELSDIYAGLQPAIAANATAMLPSGYGPIMARDVRVGVVLRTRGTFSARAVVSAVGGRRGRDVRSVNRGRLKHPLFGKHRYVDRFGVERSGWFTTMVPPGFVDKAADDIPDEAHRKALRAVDKVIVKLARG